MCDIAVATVTDALPRLREGRARAGTWRRSTWFLAICAVLLELKVGRLMPRHTEHDEDDLLGARPTSRTRVRSSWRRSGRWRSSSRAGWKTRRATSRAMSGPAPSSRTCIRTRWTKVDAAGDWRALAAQLLRPPPTLDLSHVTPIRYTMAEAMTAVERADARTSAGPASFRDLVADCEDRIQVVVRFLAMLELYREGRVELQQGATFGEIQRGMAGMRMTEHATPVTRGPSRRSSSSPTSPSRPRSSRRRSSSTGRQSRRPVRPARDASWRTEAPAWCFATSPEDGGSSPIPTPHRGRALRALVAAGSARRRRRSRRSRSSPTSSR